jgi:hypothetical protein
MAAIAHPESSKFILCVRPCAGLAGQPACGAAAILNVHLAPDFTSFFLATLATALAALAGEMAL